MVKAICFAILGFALMGCDASVTDFVKGGGDPLREVTPTPGPIVPVASGVYGIKVSPGRVTATNGTMGMDMTVSPTERVLSNGGMSMSVTISRGVVAQ